MEISNQNSKDAGRIQLLFEQIKGIPNLLVNWKVSFAIEMFLNVHRRHHQIRGEGSALEADVCVHLC